MKIRSAHLSLLLCLTVCACTQQDHASQIDKLMTKLADDGEFNGALIVSQNNEVVYSKGFGYADFEKQLLFKTSTAMDAGSIAKTFTALSILMLEQDGKLSLSDRVSQHLGTFPYDNVNINHLLYQTSGIVSDTYVFEQAPEGEVLTNAFFLEVLTKDVPPLSFEPGTQFQYNAINHILLAMVIESIGGISYDEFIGSRIAQPLVMKDWFLRPARLSNWPKNRTKGYKYMGDSLIFSDLEDFEGFYGDCNLFFSAEDLLKWSQSFYTYELMEKDHLSTLLQTKDGLSTFNPLHWYSLEDNNQYHFTGHWKGFYTMVYFDVLRKRSIVYLSNTSMAYWLRPQLVSALLNVLDNKAENLIRPDPVEPSSNDLNASYKVENVGAVTLNKEEEGLAITIDSNTYEMFEVEKTYFYVPGIDLWIWFTNSPNQGTQINCSNIYGIQTGLRL